MKKVFYVIFVYALFINLSADSLKPAIKNQIDLNDKYYSRDGASFAVVVHNEENVAMNDTGVFLHMETEQKYIHIPNLIGVKYIKWSPDDTYVLVDTGTYSYRGFICIKADEGKIIGTFQRNSEEYKFIGDNMIVATVKKGFRVDNSVSMYGIDIFKLNAESIDVSEYLVPSEFVDYKVHDLQDGNLIVAEIHYQNTGAESPWIRYKKVRTDIKEIRIDTIIDNN